MSEDKEVNVCVKSGVCGSDALGGMLLGWIPFIMGLAFLDVYGLGAGVLALTFMGGITMMVVTIIAFVKGNIFGTFAFGPIATFALSFPLMQWLPALGLAPPVSGMEAGVFLLFVGLFMFVLAFLTLFTPVRLLTLVVTFGGIALSLVGLSNIYPGETINLVAGVFLMLLGFTSTYMGIAVTANTMTGKMTMPVLLAKPKDAPAKAAEASD